MKSITVRNLATAPQHLLPAVLAGLVIGVIEVFAEVSMAALVFSGELSEFVGLGIGLFLAGSVIHCLFAILTSASPNNIAVVQDAPLVIMAVVIATLMDEMASASPTEKLATGLAVVTFSGLLAGGFFWVLGYFRLGQLVRFVPYPVVGGFLAGTGWLITVGGISAMVEGELGLALFEGEILLRWLPGFGFGVVLLLTLRRSSRFWVMPALLLGGVGLFYLIHLLLGGSLDGLRHGGWLLGPFPEGSLWRPVSGLVLREADWWLVLTTAAELSAVVLIGVISLLLNVSGLELISHEDLDLEHELRWSGIANLSSALLASPMGFSALSFSALGYQLGGRTRLVGVVATATVGLALCFGATALAGFPRMIAGGLLVYVGLSFLVEWLVDAWWKLPRRDYLMIWVILLAISSMGFLEGVGVGVFIAALIFLYDYSRTPVIRQIRTRAGFSSPVQRPPLYEQLLTQRGESLLLITLQGYVFFGTSHRLVEQLGEQLMGERPWPLRFLVLDFRLVKGIDASAALGFARFRQTTDTAGIQVVLTGLHAKLAEMLVMVGVGDTNDGHQPWRSMPTLADGVVWCEEQMIDGFAGVELSAAPHSVIDAMRLQFPQDQGTVDWLDDLQPGSQPPPAAEFAIFLGYLERIEFAPGERLVTYGKPIQAMYFLEAGSAAYQDDGEGIGDLQAGAFFGVVELYRGESAAHTIISTAHGWCYRLPVVSLQRMEQEHPRLALALHRELAAWLTEQTGRMRLWGDVLD